VRRISLLEQARKRALQWTAATAFVTVLISACLFTVLFIKDAEKDALLTAQASISSYRSDILSGDVRSIELQLQRDFKINDSDLFIFLDPQKHPWVGDLRTVKLNSCSEASGVCRDLINGKIILQIPIYFDSGKTALWGYLHIEKTPNIHWDIIIFVSVAILLGMLLLSTVLYSQFIKSVSLVSTTMANWSDQLCKNPKDSSFLSTIPFKEIEPIAHSLAGLNKEISLLEKAAHEQGSLNTLRSIGHDILNPVSRIKRMLGVLQIQAKANTNANPNVGIDPEIFNNLNSNLKRLSGYAEQIKSLYRKNTGEYPAPKATVDLSKELMLLSTELAQDAEALHKKISIEADLEPNCFVNIPAPVIGRIAENLILNSFQASAENSKVRIRSFSTDLHVGLLIDDEGSGISENLKEKIFEPNFTTKANKGTGLGLFVAKQLCEEYRGTIQFTSSLGQGTTFELTFPRAEISS